MKDKFREELKTSRYWLKISIAWFFAVIMAVFSYAGIMVYWS